jgi:hypothetical protein
MARLRSPSLFHTVTEHPAMLFVAMFVAASDVTGFMFFGPCSLVLPEMWGRRSCKAPGCLKSESEERETWTAESLRAASSNGEGLGSKDPDFFRKSSGHGRDFGGRRFRYHYCRESGRWEREQSRAHLCAHVQKWDLVKTL